MSSASTLGYDETNGYIIKSSSELVSINSVTPIAPSNVTNKAYVDTLVSTSITPALFDRTGTNLTTHTNGDTLTLDNVNVNNHLKYQSCSGYVSGFAITDNGTGTITVTNGICMIKASTLSQAIQYNVTGVTNQALTDNSTNYVAISYNSGTPIIVILTSNITIDNVSIISIYEVMRDNIYLRITSHKQLAVNIDQEHQKYLYDKYDTDYISGGVMSANLKKLSITECVMYIMLDRTTIAAITDAVFFTNYVTNGTWTKVVGVTDFSTTQYNNIATGLATVASNRYSFHEVFLFPNGSVSLVYGQAIYNSQALAETAPILTNLPTNVSFDQHHLYLGRIVFQGSGSTALSILSAFTKSLSSTQTTNHSQLSNLTSDDHPQYSLNSNVFNEGYFLNGGLLTVPVQLPIISTGKYILNAIANTHTQNTVYYKRYYVSSAYVTISSTNIYDLSSRKNLLAGAGSYLIIDGGYYSLVDCWLKYSDDTIHFIVGNGQYVSQYLACVEPLAALPSDLSTTLGTYLGRLVFDSGNNIINTISKYDGKYQRKIFDNSTETIAKLNSKMLLLNGGSTARIGNITTDYTPSEGLKIKASTSGLVCSFINETNDRPGITYICYQDSIQGLAFNAYGTANPFAWKSSNLYSTLHEQAGANYSIYKSYKSGGPGSAIDNFSVAFQIQTNTSNTNSILFPGSYTQSIGATYHTLSIDSTGKIGYVASLRAHKIEIPNPDYSWLYQLRCMAYKRKKMITTGEGIEEFLNEPETDILEYGLIAEEAELINENICTYKDTANPLRYKGDNSPVKESVYQLTGINYNKLITPILSELQIKNAEISTLKGQVSTLLTQLSLLASRVNSLEIIAHSH